MSDQGRPLPKFGEWDVNDPASAEGFTVIFNKARDEKKTGGKPESVEKADPQGKPEAKPGKSQTKKWFCCVLVPDRKSWYLQGMDELFFWDSILECKIVLW
ncbi:protein NOI4-like [Hibiscus syriacus]|uniref:protein NOI4-like n=1 Tax=Hibiscus syriacus TaxID=106335 RepID=UPI001924DCA0|nr:protein NOI4-like [Hibiscus syriacus]